MKLENKFYPCLIAADLAFPENIVRTNVFAFLVMYR